MISNSHRPITRINLTGTDTTYLSTKPSTTRCQCRQADNRETYNQANDHTHARLALNDEIESKYASYLQHTLHSYCQHLWRNNRMWATLSHCIHLTSRRFMRQQRTVEQTLSWFNTYALRLPVPTHADVNSACIIANTEKVKVTYPFWLVEYLNKLMTAPMAALEEQSEEMGMKAPLKVEKQKSVKHILRLARCVRPR